MKLIRWITYLWTSPTTAIGLAVAGVTLLTGGKVQVVKGVLETCGGVSEIFLRRIVGLFMVGGASAMTLGHVVMGRDEASLELTRSHERVHVRQCERWGPIFIPAYLIASLIARLRGKRAYRDNFFEREAFDHAG